MPYINTDVWVDISDLDEEDVLAEAVEIVRRAGKAKHSNSLVADGIAKLRQVIFQPETDDDAEPLSAAAKLRTADDLRDFVERSNGFYCFAGHTQ